MKNFHNTSIDKYISFIISSMIIIFALPGQSMGFCAFTEPILRTTGLSRNTFSTIYMFATILGCCGVLISGKLIDIFGIKKSLIIVLPIWISTLFIFSLCDTIHALFSGILSDICFYTIFFTLLIFVLRFLGQNFLPLLGRVQIVRIFNHKQGIAIAASGLFVSLANGIVPSLMRALTINDDWQHTFRLLSFSGIFLFIIIILFLKDSNPAVSVTNIVHPSKELHLTFASKKELLKMPIFWCITFALCLNAFIGSGTVVHVVDIFREKNVPESIALGTYIPLCISTTIFGFIFGKLLDSNHIKLCAMLMFLAQFLGLTGLIHTENKFFILLYTIAIGGSWGGYGVLVTASWSKIFGPKHIGDILGLVYFLSTITGAISVPLMSIFKQIFGSYTILLNIIRIIIVLCTIFCLKKFPK